TGSEYQMFRRSSHDFEYAIPAHRGGPAPEHPGMFALGNGEENHLGAADQILERHIAHRRQHAAVGRVIPVVAHHEEMVRRHGVDDGVVVETVVDTIES